MAEIQYLDDLLDVQVPAPDDGDVLYWDAAAARWKSKPIPVGAGGTVERIIRHSADDCRCFYLPEPYLFSITTIAEYAGCYSTTHYACGSGLRFLHIYIPKGATITHAYLKLISYANITTEIVNTKIQCELNADPLEFSTVDDLIARERTTQSVNWDAIPAWTKDVEYTSPDFKDVIKEIVDLDAWESGNPLVIFWGDPDDRSTHGSNIYRRAWSWDGDTEKVPVLYIEWTA